MENLTNRDDSEVRALSALKALEMQRLALEAGNAEPVAVTEDSSVRAISALREMEEERLARMAEFEQRHPPVQDASPATEVERLGEAAEAAVDRYAAAEEALACLADDGDPAGPYAAAAQELASLAESAERAVDAYAAAQAKAERLQAERAEAATVAPSVVALPVDVWPTAPVDDIVEMPMPDMGALKRRSPLWTLAGLLVAVGVVVFAVVLFQQSAPADLSGGSESPSTTPAVKAAPTPAPARALTPAEQARKDWEESQAARKAEARRSNDGSKSRRRNRKDDDRKKYEGKVKVNCDPNDPLCGVDM